MKRVAFVLCLLAAPIPAEGQDASGKWELTVTTTERPDPRTTSMILKKEGDKLSGTIVGPQNTELTVAGTQTGSDISLSFKVPTQDGVFEVSMKGRQDGHAMKGTLEVSGGADSGQWSATRSGSTAGKDSGAGDLTGTWALEVDTEFGKRTPSVTLKQERNTLSGQYHSQLGEAPVTGQVKDQTFTFQVTLTFEGNPVTITYTGTVDRSIVKGHVTLGDAAGGTFTGKKQEAGK